MDQKLIDDFAGQAMVGLLIQNKPLATAADIAARAYDIALAMCLQRERMLASQAEQSMKAVRRGAYIGGPA